MIEKRCENCWNVFYAAKSKGKYCSKKCSGEVRKKIKICPTCWVEFHSKWTIYCSHQCYAKSRILPDRECLICWKLFHPNEASQRYCSNACWWVAQRRHGTRLCPTCNIEFKATFKWQKHCSSDCYNKSREVKEKKCVVCWKIFKPYINSIITCSKECHSKYKKQLRDDMSEENKKRRIDIMRAWEEEIISKPNLLLMERLTKEWFDVELEYWVGGYYYDLKIWNTIIEVNPRVHHNSTRAPPKNKNSKPKDKYYHRDKALCAMENWFNIIMMWDWICKKEIIWILKWNESEILIHNNDELWEPKLHWYNPKTKEHIVDVWFNRDEMINKWFFEIYDAWKI